MKNLLRIIAVFALFAFSTNTIEAQTCFDKGSITISPGVSLGNYGYYGNANFFSVPIILSAEYHFMDMVSAGPFISRSIYRRTNYNWSYTTFGARGSFHWNTLLEGWTGGDWKSEQFDLYTTAMAGFEVASLNRNDGFTNPVDPFNNRPVYGILIGARWYFIPNIAVFAEVGRGSLGVLTGGITIKI